MQSDMHYYGTYAMARAAGINQNAANIIATCAQFVDDNVAETALEFESGARIDCEPTAHHTIDVQNLDPEDQRQVWVPFHFLPGDVGESYRDRMKCRKDSDPAKKMIQHHLSFADREFACALMGIGAHVYADTFSHYGFSGISSRGNGIQQTSINVDVKGILGSKIKEYVLKKQKTFYAKYFRSINLPNIKDSITGVLAEKLSGALGHGSVSTYPDRPYLRWEFKYDEDDAECTDRVSHRNNPETFLEGCQALHDAFHQFAENSRDKYSAEDARDFSAIQETVKGILAVQGKKEERIQAWKDAAQSGGLFGSSNGESMPDYDGESWNNAWKSFNEQADYSNAIKSDIWRFYQAAAIHRTYVLRDLLPSYGLVVD